MIQSIPEVPRADKMTQKEQIEAKNSENVSIIYVQGTIHDAGSQR